MFSAAWRIVFAFAHLRLCRPLAHEQHVWQAPALRVTSDMMAGNSLSQPITEEGIKINY